MRFKATFTDKGLRILEKAFLPTLEKCGKTCQVLLGEEEINLVQQPVNTDGSCVAARFNVGVLFTPDSFKLASRHRNLIAFQLDVTLLLRVLRSASANGADVLDVKLTSKAVSLPGAEGEAQKPFLSFSGRGSNLSLVQDLPISKPYTPSQIDQLIEAKEPAALCPYYVDIQRCVGSLQAMVERMKSINDALLLATCKNGDFHVSVSAVNLMLGSQARELPVFPTTVAPAYDTDRSAPTEQQLQAAIESGDGIAVNVPLKQMLKLLSVCPLSGPSQILCGIAEEGAYVHLMFVYRDPLKDAAYDDTVALSFKLPVQSE